MKKLIFTMIALLAMATVTFAQGGGLVYHGVGVVDESGRPVTSISTVTVRLPGTTTAATIYKDVSRTLAITQPITTTSTNTTLSNGVFYWYGPDGWDYTIGDGTNSLTNYGHDPLTASASQITFPSYVQAITSTSYADAQSATFGSDSDFVLAAGTAADTFTVIPSTTDETPIWNFGESTTGMDVKSWAATAGDYLLWDASEEALTWVGVNAHLDDDSILYIGSDKDWSIFSSTTKILQLTPLGDETYGITVGADTAGADLLVYGATTGEKLFWDSSGDYLHVVGDKTLMTLTGTTLPVRIDATGTVAAGNAIEIETTSGPIQILADGSTTGDITIDAEDVITIVSTDAHAAGIYLHANGGTSETIKIHSDQGTSVTEGAESINILSDVGGIGLRSAANLANAIQLTVDGGTTSSILIFNDQGSAASATTETDASIMILSDAGGIGITSTGNVADAIRIEANGGASETVAISSVKGTGADSIDVDSLVGGVTIEAHAASKDVLINSALGSVKLTSAEAATDAVNIDATGTNGGIDMDTTDGAIALTTAGAANGDMTLTVADKFTLISTDTSAAGIDIEANGGTSETIHIHANQSTAQNALDVVLDVGGATITASAVPDAAYGTKLSGSIAGATRSEGVGLYVEGNITGAVDGKTYATGSWLNITGGTPVSNAAIYSAMDVGIYADSAPVLTAAYLRVLNLEYQVDSAVTPAMSSMMHFNTDDTAADVPDYWFTTGNVSSVAYAVDAGTTNSKTGAIKIYLGGVGDRYIWVYSTDGTP